MAPAIIIWTQKKKFIIALLYFLGLTLNGCSLLNPVMLSKEDMAKHAEDVFKHQNQMTQQIMLLSEDELTESEEERISSYELQMYDACRLLNEYARSESEGKQKSVIFRTQLKRSLNTCADRVKQMEELLKSIENTQ